LINPFPLATRGLPEALTTALLPHIVAVRVRAGRTLVSPDLRSTNVHLVAAGRVQVALLSSAGHEIILRDLGVGDMFGELASIDGQPRSASIFALDDCLILSIPARIFKQAVFETPASAEWLARRLVAQIRDLTFKVFEMTALRVPGRLHCELFRLCGTIDNDIRPVVIDPFPTHKELAARIGAHREAVTREMQFLARRQIVRQQRRRLTVLDVPALVNLVRRAAGQIGPEEEPRSAAASRA
jgi:CRP/FNR family transcriptional regulator, cyclic AMP receptor protein